MSTTPYLERLGNRIQRTGAVLCVGIDPDPAALPPGSPGGLPGVERFARLIVESCAAVAAAFKPNLAYFEAFGSAGLAAFEALRGAIPADIPVIIDAKRGDIGSTAERQARAIVDGLRADAVTLSPYLGRDAVFPFLEHGAFAYVLCRTSNPSAAQIQDLVVGPGGATDAVPERLHERIARVVDGWDEGRGGLGLVVGATAPAELAAVRGASRRLPFLVPGVGAQGGPIADAMRNGRATEGPAGAQPGGALLVNVSRGIAEAALDPARDPGEALQEAAFGWAARLRLAPV